MSVNPICTGLLLFRDHELCVPIDERIFTSHLVGRHRKWGDRQIPFFVLTPESTHSPFSNEQQVTTSAANGKLNRIKIREKRVVEAFNRRGTPAPNYATVDREISLSHRPMVSREETTDELFGS